MSLNDVQGFNTYTYWPQYPYYAPYQQTTHIKQVVEDVLRENGLLKDEPKATPVDELAGEYAEVIFNQYIEQSDFCTSDDINYFQAFLVAFAEELKEKGII